MTRLIVSVASIVCRVLSTRWPVSAADRAAAAVSVSRISPTRMTSGSWRRTTRMALAKDVGVEPDLPLLDRGHLVVVEELDGVLDGDDVAGPRSG